MKRASFFLALDGDRWQATRLRADGCVDCCEVEAQPEDGPLSECLKGWGYEGEPACLGLPSQMLLTAEIDASGLPRKQRRATMLYRLEEQLPLDAEALTVSFIPSAGGRALGLAVKTAAVLPIVERLQRLGVEVAAVCPTSLLAYWHLTRNGVPSCDHTVIANRTAVDVFRSIEGCPAAWHSCPPDAGRVKGCIKADLLARPIDEREPTTRLLGEACPGLDDLRSVERCDASYLETAAKAAGSVLGGEGPEWLDLRRDGLGEANPWRRVSKLLVAAVVLGLAFWACLEAALWLRAAHYEWITQDREQKQEALYRRLYPSRPFPPNVKSRLKSELTRLSGLSGANSELPERASALESLRLITSSLPANVRLRILEMRLDPSGVYVEGQVQNHSDAELIVKALKKAGLDMTSPRTEQLAGGGVSFTLLGKPAPTGEQK